MDLSVSVVIATRDRHHQLLRSLAHLASMPEHPRVIVVDNASADGTTAAVRELHPEVRVIEMPRNLGAVARNIGVAAARTRHVAFADDDSWWEPGSLYEAVRLLDEHDDIGVVAGRVVVEPSGLVDPMSQEMASSPLPARAGWPGPSILGFLACSAVVRREAFLSARGFDDLLFFLGEEELLAYDLRARGWGLVYVDHLVAHHHPGSVTREPAPRRTRQARNHVLVALMRRPARIAVGRFVALCRAAAQDPAARRALIEVLQRVPAALQRRTQPAPAVERDLALLTSSSTRVGSPSTSVRGTPAGRGRRSSLAQERAGIGSGHMEGA